MHILSFLAKLTRNIYVFYFIIFIPVAILVYKNVKNMINIGDEEEENDGEDSKDTEKDKD